MNWWRMMIALLTLGAGPAMADDWAVFKDRFIRDGRVVDTDNGGISHSEGQGYGMLLAVAHDDPATFEALWSWTRETLRRPDGLFSWKYDPDAEGGPRVTDVNNATDGDILIAWALARAAEWWQEPAHGADADAIAGTVLGALVVTTDQGALLLPGQEGFTGPDKRVVNPSYWVFPALAELGRRTGDARWGDLTAGGLDLLARARFGRWNLPPDWLETAGDLRPATDFPPRFGYNNVRVPLYLVWGGVDSPERLAPYLGFWAWFKDCRFVPAWTDVTDNAVTTDNWSPGIRAIALLARAAADGRRLDPARVPAIGADDGYYSAVLLLLTRLAAREAP